VYRVPPITDAVPRDAVLSQNPSNGVVVTVFVPEEENHLPLVPRTAMMTNLLRRHHPLDDLVDSRVITVKPIVIAVVLRSVREMADVNNTQNLMKNQ